jgi:hypothetical protein
VNDDAPDGADELAIFTGGTRPRTRRRNVGTATVVARRVCAIAAAGRVAGRCGGVSQWRTSAGEWDGFRSTTGAARTIGCDAPVRVAALDELCVRFS